MRTEDRGWPIGWLAVRTHRLGSSAARLACAPAQARAGFTLLEVMIALAVLAVIMSAVAASMSGLDSMARMSRERAQAQQVARALAERVLGGTWDTLGKDVGTLANRNAWSWHRREQALAANPAPPLNEVSSDPLNRLDELRDGGGNLISPGLVATRTGLRDIAVHLEYYRMDLMTDLAVASDPQAVWATAASAAPGAQALHVFDHSNAHGMDLRPERDAVLVRVLVLWTPAGADVGARQRHEVIFARRK